MRWFVGILLTVALFFGCATKIPDTVVESQKIEERVKAQPTVEEQLAPFFYTVPQSAEQYVYSSVGRIDSEEGLIGSGVYIGNRMVLTAGHVLFQTGAKYFSVGKYRGCIEIAIVHPGYFRSEVNVENDIGIAILDEEPPIEIEPAEISKNLMSKKGDAVYTVGYSFAKKKLSKPGVFLFYGILMEEPQFLKLLSVQATIFFGDSGGGVFDCNGKLIGIISYFTIIYAHPCDNSATRVDYYWQWILFVEDRILHEQANPA